MPEEAQRHNTRHNTKSKRRATPAGQLSAQQRELLAWLLQEEKRIQQTGTEKAQALLIRRGILFSQKKYLDTGEVTPSQRSGLSRRIRSLEKRGLLIRNSQQATHIRLTETGRREAERLTTTGGRTARQADRAGIIPLPSGPLELQAYTRADWSPLYQLSHLIPEVKPILMGRRLARRDLLDALGEHDEVAHYSHALRVLEEKEKQLEELIERTDGLVAGGFKKSRIEFLYSVWFSWKELSLDDPRRYELLAEYPDLAKEMFTVVRQDAHQQLKP